MRFQIQHSTRYTYSKPVFIEPMTIRLRPRTDCTQRLDAFQMQIDPLPAGVGDCVDLDGNNTHHTWFNDLHDHLQVTTQCQVETLRADPFGFVIPAEASRLPMQYDASLTSSLAPYRTRQSTCKAVDDLARRVLDSANNDTLRFLGGLSQHLYDTIKVGDRHDHGTMTPEQTLSGNSGACRDVAVLYIDACRSVGVAARFVSGYVYDEKKTGDQPMHAWAEAYLPDAGWRGYDPTNGLAAADCHVAVAASAAPELAAPTTGAFRGTGATSTLVTRVSIIAAGDTSATQAD